MTQLNLLPDVKLEYIKAQRSRRMAVSISFLACVGTIGLLILLLAASGLQKKHLNDLSQDIKTDSTKLQKKPEIAKILTVQNQLGSLTALHSEKPAASRLFDYLNEVTPPQVSITSFKVDFTEQTSTITGTSESLSSVNKYIDTLKFTTYKVKGGSSGTKAFSNVVLTNFGLSSNLKQANGQPANYTITLGYDKNIFDITQNVSLSVPSLNTTRSALAQPKEDLFQAPATPAKTTKEGAN